MNFILFDDPVQWKNLLPLTYTKPIAALRTGILTIKEKWGKYLNTTCSFKTINYLQQKFPIHLEDLNIYINGSILPDKDIVDKIVNLNEKNVLIKNNLVIAFFDKGNKETNLEQIGSFKQVPYSKDISVINYPWEIFIKNKEEIKSDIQLIFKNRKSYTLSETNNLIGKENIYVEKGVKAEFTTINATFGPIYLGKDSEVMEGSVIRGPFALCDHSKLKLSAKVYGPVTIGPYCKVGGEICESVIQGYSNKAHDGFLGNAVIGEWCNLGADTNNSNLKNNYKNVRIWNYIEDRFIDTGLQFCGLIMGDHSKCGINTMFNTGTVVGVSANIFGSGFQRNFIPSFSWGGTQGFTTYQLNKVFETAQKVMTRRNLQLDETEKEILNNIFNLTKKYRKL